jgi:hypothetical protein
MIFHPTFEKTWKENILLALCAGLGWFFSIFVSQCLQLHQLLRGLASEPWDTEQLLQCPAGRGEETGVEAECQGSRARPPSCRQALPPSLEGQGDLLLSRFPQLSKDRARGIHLFSEHPYCSIFLMPFLPVTSGSLMHKCIIILIVFAFLRDAIRSAVTGWRCLCSSDPYYT